MAAPFAPMPTLAEFVRWATEQGCSETDDTIEMWGPRGNTVVRMIDGPEGQRVVLPDIEEAEHLTPIMISNLSRRLKIASHPAAMPSMN